MIDGWEKKKEKNKDTQVKMSTGRNSSNRLYFHGNHQMLLLHICNL